MRTYKEEIAALLAPLTGLLPGVIHDSISLPQHPDHGDFAFPCFLLAKQLRKPPAAIATELAGSLNPSPPIAKVEALGGYLNFFVDKAEFARRTLTAIAGQGEHYGDLELGAGKTVVIDYSSPNMGKELSFHHLRGTMIGNALSRIYRKAGFQVVRINHLGDWGTSYGKLIVMFRREGLGKADLPGLTIERLNALYKSFEAASREDETLEDQAREAFQRLEAGDPANRELWEAFRETTLVELRRLYAILGVEFDHYTGEAFFLDHMEKVMDDLSGRGLVVRSRGADIVDLEAHGMPPVLLRKTDGATLYITRDIAAAIYRKAAYGFDKCLYVVDNGQSLHFQQLFKVLELMGFDWAKSLEHVPYGVMLLKGEDGNWEKGKTRSGQSNLLKDVIKRAQEKILAIMEEKNPEALGKDALARQIAVGALVFSDLKNRRLGDIRFEWDKALSFEGDTGPYVQNAHVRLCSILRKAGLRKAEVADSANIDFGNFPEASAQNLIQALSLLPHKIETAVNANDPCPLAQYALEIAEATHSFVHSCRVLGSPQEKDRLFLIDCARAVLGQSLDLIGVPAIEAM